MRRTPIALLAVLLVVAASVPAGAAPAGPAADAATVQENCSFPVTMTDAGGTEVTIDERPDRVTTLLPSAAQTMWEIGGESQVVGVTRYATYLDGAESKVNVSAGFSVSVEKVIGTEPDLVLAPNGTSQDTITALRDAGLTVYSFEIAESIDDVRNKTTLIGRLTGNCEEAARTNAWMTANVEAAREATADVERPRVLYPLGGGYVTNTNTFISEMIEVSGGANVVGETNATLAYPQISDEVILELDPEVIITTQSNAYLLTQEPYASTTAGQNQRTVRVDVNYLNQPAPRSVVYATRNLTAGFHPEAAESAAFISKDEVTLATPTPTATPTEEPTPTPTAEPTPTPTSSGGQPGFGLAAALCALAAVGLLARRE